MDDQVNSSNSAWFYYSRIALGQIKSVQEDKGTCTVWVFDNLGQEMSNLELPSAGMSFQQHRSSWFRYMPQVADLCFVGFAVNGSPRILGYTAGVGYVEEFFKQKKDKQTSQHIPADFRKLKQGEWDLRSPGGAYIHGSVNGALLLAAGPYVQSRYDKVNNELHCKSGLYVWESEGSFARLGDYKRLIPGTHKDTDLSSLDPYVPKEWAVHIEDIAGFSVAEDTIGSVRLPGGAPEPSTLDPSSFIRSRRKVCDDVGLNAYSHDVDSSGNSLTTYGEKAIASKIFGPTVRKSITYATVDVTTGVATVTCPDIKLGSDAAVEPGLLGLSTLAALSTFTTQLSVELKALAGALGAASSFAPLTTEMLAASAAATAASVTTDILTSVLSSSSLLSKTVKLI